MAFDFDEFTKKVNKKYPYWKENLLRDKKEPTFVHKAFIVIAGCVALCFSLFVLWVIGVAFNRIWLELDYTVRDLRHGLGLRDKKNKIIHNQPQYHHRLYHYWSVFNRGMASLHHQQSLVLSPSSTNY